MTRSGGRSTGKTGLPRQQGYSLLEILIAVLVLSIGLLGLAGLQTTSLQSNQSAAQVSQATFLAQDMFDRMRANSEEARNGNYNLDFGDSSDDYEGSSL
ncbi:type IV pilus modification protein PilV, partial [Aquisalimonas sp.]|uniref:type IV pilus modification protein PilV n=1 Tax=Aquisalimonas sp. TaxID=1872621 RepID=UPI0025B7EE66